MSRKIICLALAAALLLSVSGGMASGQEKYVFNPHLYLPVLAQDVPQDYWDAFHNLCDALRAGETTFACPGEDAYKWATSSSTLTQLFPVACMKIKAGSGDGSAPYENGVGKIVYRIPADVFLGRQAQFEALVEDVLNTCLEPGDSDYEKCLKLFDYMSANYTYNDVFTETMLDGANYLAFMTRKGQCIELGSVYAYFLLQAGVEALLVECSNPSVAHGWTYTVLDGKGYHSDPTWSLRSPGENLSLYYFLMDDARREDTGCPVDDLTSPLLPGYWVKRSAADLTAPDPGYCFPPDAFLKSLDVESGEVRCTCGDGEFVFRYGGK